MEPSSAPTRQLVAAPSFWLEDFPSLPFGDGQAGAGEPEEAWSLDDFVWDPVVLVGARRTAGADEAAAPPALLAPSLAAKSVALPGAPARRRVYSRRPEVCHVPGCGVALSDTPDAPRYCFRFRICALHLRAEEVLFPDGAKRHCQKCCAFHPLTAFTGAKRTCARRLAEQAARRAADAAAGNGSGDSGSRGPPRSNSGDADSSDALLFDFVDTLLKPQATVADGALDSADDGVALAPSDWACAALPLPDVHEASLKLGGATPWQLPAALAPALASAWCAEAANALEATPRPGCTLLHLDALLPAGVAVPDAASLAARLHAGPLRAWLAGRRLAVRCGGDSSWPAAEVEMPARLPRLRPSAVLSTAQAELRATAQQPLPVAGVALCGRLHGQCCAGASLAAGTDGRLRLLLPALQGAEGVARLWLAREGSAGGSSRPVLLTCDADVAAELATALDSLDDDVAERLQCVLGAALRPGCAPRVLAAACAQALRRGWAATARRLLPSLRVALDTGAADVEGIAAARMLLHHAALSGEAAMIRLTLSHGAAFGSPSAADEAGITPMHLAAAGGSAAAVTALATATPAATVAWFVARDAAGRTPADVARAAGGAAADAHAALRLRLETARDRVSSLAADTASGTATSGGDEIDELARFLLDTHAPSGGVASGPERALFDAERFEARRPFATLLPKLCIAMGLSWLRSSPLTAVALADVASPAQPSFAAMINVHKAVLAPLCPQIVVINVALLLLTSLPALRGLYLRHGRAALIAYCAYQFMLIRLFAEQLLRRALHGGVAMWPSPQGSALVSMATLHMAAMPLPVRDILALMAVQWALAGAAHVTGAPLWPVSVAPGRDAIIRTTVSAVTAAALLAVDRRALVAWRAERRARLAARKKQA